MSAAEQLGLDLPAPIEGVKLISPPPRRDEIGICDDCQGRTHGETYATIEAGHSVMRCRECDRKARRR